MCLRGRSLPLETGEYLSDSHFPTGIPGKVPLFIDGSESQRREKNWLVYKPLPMSVLVET